MEATEVDRNEAFEAQLNAMLGVMHSFNLEWLCGESPQDIVAAEWVEHGFTSKTVGAWWLARCFEPVQAAELRDAGIEPEDVCRACAVGDTVGYHHSNFDLGLDDVRELIRR